MIKYVQRVDGYGAKWKVITECNTGWRVQDPHSKNDRYLLPKSEYRLCTPPEPTWKDVTGECTIDESGAIFHKGSATMLNDAYRRRLVKKVIAHATDYVTFHAIVIEQAIYEE